MPAIDPVTIDFQIRGLPEITKAFETVEQRMKRLENEGTANAKAQSETRIRTARKEVDEREKAYQKMVREMERDEEKGTQTALREMKKQADGKRREEERLQADLERMRRRSSEMAGRYAAQQVAQEVREAEKAKSAWERVSAAQNAATGRSQMRILGHVGSSIGGMLGGAASFAKTSLALGGGAILADAVHRELAAEKSAALLVNQVTVGGTPPAGATVQNILGQASQVARETGMSKEELIEGTRSYARTARGGDFTGAMANMGFFAKMSQVTGVDMGEISGAAGMLQSQNATLAADPKKMQQMLLDILAQTKNGSLGMTQMIAQAGKIGSVRSAFQGDESTNQRKLMALGQLVAPAAGDESGIMIKDFALEATKGKHLAQAKAMGVKFDSLNRMQSPEQAIQAVLRSSGGDISKIEEVFGSRGGTLLRELGGGYANAVAGAGGRGSKAGMAAGDKYLSDTIGSVTGSTMSSDDLSKQFEQMMSTPAEKFERAWNSIVDTIENKAEPYLEQFAEKLPEITPYIDTLVDELGKFANWFSTDPLGGVGQVVKTALEIDIAKAAIGEAVKTMLTRMLIGSAGGSEGGGAGTAVAGAVAGSAVKSGAGGILGIAKKWIPRAIGGYLAVEAYRGLLEATSAEENVGQNLSLRRSTEGSNAASALLAKTRGGTVTAADIAAAGKMKATLEGQLKGEKEYAETGGGFWQIGGKYGSANEARRAAGAGEAKNTEMALSQLNEAIKKSAAALEKHTTATVADAAATNSAKGVKGDPARNNPIDQRNPPHS